MTVSTRTVAISNIEIKVWTRKGELSKGNLLCSLTQSKITRKITFELTDIEYDQINIEISRMERVEYNTAVVFFYEF